MEQVTHFLIAKILGMICIFLVFGYAVFQTMMGFDFKKLMIVLGIALVPWFALLYFNPEGIYGYLYLLPYPLIFWEIKNYSEKETLDELHSALGSILEEAEKDFTEVLALLKFKEHSIEGRILKEGLGNNLEYLKIYLNYLKENIHTMPLSQIRNLVVNDSKLMRGKFEPSELKTKIDLAQISKR